MDRWQAEDDFLDWNERPLTSDDETLGEWLHQTLSARFANETEAWAIERVTRVSTKLNTVRAECPVRGACPYPLHTEILWIGEPTAFAVPGRWVYLARELLQEFTGDEPVAFVLAHEIAHHDLGHVRRIAPTIARLRAIPGGVIAGLIVEACTRALHHPAREAAADVYALHLCVAAGYNPRRCLELFDALERYALNMRDLDGVFGTDEELQGNDTGPIGQLRRALWRQKRGYAPLRERRTILETLIRRDYG